MFAKLRLSWLRFLLLLFLTSSPLAGSVVNHFVLRGEVHLQSEGPLRGRRALVVLRGVRTPYLAKTLTSLGGRFKFKRVPPGLYVLSAEVRDLGTSQTSVDVSSSLADANGRITQVLVVEPDAPAVNRVSVASLAVSSKSRQSYLKAEKLISEGKIDRAVQRLEQLVEKEPMFAEAHNLLGTIAYQRRDYPTAEGHFRNALEASPEAFAPLVNLGGTLNSMNRPEEALEANLNAYEQRPEDPLVNSQLGLSYWQLGQLDQAIEFLTRAKQQDPGHFSYPQLALAQIYLSRNQLGAARKELQEFLDLHPDAEQAPAIRDLLKKIRLARQP